MNVSQPAEKSSSRIAFCMIAAVSVEYVIGPTVNVPPSIPGTESENVPLGVELNVIVCTSDALDADTCPSAWPATMLRFGMKLS